MIQKHMTKRTIKHMIKRAAKRTAKRMIKRKIMHIVTTIKNEQTVIIFKLLQCILTAFKQINQIMSSYSSNEFKNSEIDHLI